MDELICTMVGSKPEVDIASTDLLQVPHAAGEPNTHLAHLRAKNKKRNGRKSIDPQRGGPKGQGSAPEGVLWSETIGDSECAEFVRPALNMLACFAYKCSPCCRQKRQAQESGV